MPHVPSEPPPTHSAHALDPHIPVIEPFALGTHEPEDSLALARASAWASSRRRHASARPNRRYRPSYTPFDSRTGGDVKHSAAARPSISRATSPASVESPQSRRCPPPNVQTCPRAVLHFCMSAAARSKCGPALRFWGVSSVFANSALIPGNRTPSIPDRSPSPESPAVPPRGRCRPIPRSAPVCYPRGCTRAARLPSNGRARSPARPRASAGAPRRAARARRGCPARRPLNRVREAERLDRARDLRDLRRRVRAGVARVGNQALDRPMLDLRGQDRLKHAGVTPSPSRPSAPSPAPARA